MNCTNTSKNVQVTTQLSKFETFTYKWNFKDWSCYKDYEVGESIVSPPFYLLNSTWYLFMYPNGKNKQSEDYVSAFLHRPNYNGIPPIGIRYAFCLATIDDHIIANHDSVKKSRFDSSMQTWGVNHLVHKSAFGMLNAPSAEITFYCRIITEEETLQEKSRRLSCDRAQHLEAYEIFVDNEQFSDVKIQVEGKEILAHKMVLSTHSPVFSAMFEHEMRENEENVVIIEDISYNVFYELLRFMYLGTIYLDKDTVAELFKAADKYQLIRLRTMCEEKLCKIVSIDNVFVYLNLADMYSAKNLKKKTIDFIAANMMEILQRPELESLKNLDMSLFKECLLLSHTKKK